MFFPIVVFLYFMIPYSKRWILLLSSSFYFYMCWKPEYVILLILSITINYFTALQMGKQKDKLIKKIILILTLVVNIGILALFKYYNFISSSVTEFLSTFNIMYNLPSLKLLLPVGISFYTFQTMGYSIDVYRGKIQPEKHFGIFGVYVSFFPQLIAGPIERSTSLLPQFKKKFNADYSNITDGSKLMLWGFFKKIVIADRLAVVVNNVYDNVPEHDSIAFVIATFFFAFQIYCDFSGYSDIAIGSAHVMGYKLMDNFKQPYYSKNIAEFWKYWHISLSSWLRDYVFLPLSFSISRKLPNERYLGIKTDYIIYMYATLITFLISGIWHGANWTFIVWGLLHGTYLVIGKLTHKIRKKMSYSFFKGNFLTLRKSFNVIFTFILVCFAWIFFRANNISDSLLIIHRIISGFTAVFDMMLLKQSIETLGLEKYELTIGIFSIVLLELFHILQKHGSIRHLLRSKPLLVRWALYFSLILLILLLGYSSEQAEFIYFQF